MRKDGPKQGIPIAADPATVERSGSAIRQGLDGRMGRMVRPAPVERPAGKATEDCHDQPGWDASSSTNRPPFRESTFGKARRVRSRLFGAWRREPGDLPSKKGIRPTQGSIAPDASTEVVLAPDIFARSRSAPVCRWRKVER